MRIGVDTGGTFTDFVIDDGEDVRVFKVPSTPSAPEAAIASGCSGLSGFELCHGTTVGTNAILEGKLGRTAFLSNFPDLPFLGRQTRPLLYELEPEVALPPVLGSDCFSVRGRLGPDGGEIEALDLGGLPDLSGYEAAAVCLLFSYANPEHEVAVGEALGSYGIPVSLSHLVSPEFREYERACATILNAGLSPVMSRYLGRLRDSVGFGRALVMSSAGGLVSLEVAEGKPLLTAVSGPAAGVVAVNALGKRLGMERLVGFDMGGTSTDVAVASGALPFTSIGEMAGIPVRLHRVDVHTIGCGGGSVAWLDAAGALRVGPQSAGADPGPALYGRGAPVTVTDANFVLGKLSGARFGVGVDARACEMAIRDLADRVGVSQIALAEAIVEIAEAQMGRAIRKVTSERGLDPSEFWLVSYGGAGGLHACAIAETLGMRGVIVPRTPGVFSAEGLLAAPEIAEESVTVLGRPFDLTEEFGKLMAFAKEVLGSFDRAHLSADMRYRGQSHEVNVGLELGESVGVVEERFRSMHESIYGVRHSDVAVEWVTLRVRLERWPANARRVSMARELGEATVGCCAVIAMGREVSAIIYDRDNLRIGSKLNGAAVVVQGDATTYVPVGWRGIVLGGGELELKLG
ncbi:MAG: hydantoinase/oxoprolinase family protein [Fimbriimonadales bacterium]|nr:hydantoinase/oxoprolinase family protein [Fimbriimonadales bacterium]